jgi:predicted enzyme related to lactoylglutathione lyase
MLPSRHIAEIILAVAAFIGQGNSAPAQDSASVHAASIAVAPQYDTTHVYVAPADVNAFVASFVGTFGGTTTKQVSVTVTPTPSTTTSQLLQTPVGTVSLFGFTTPIPTPFGAERTGYLVSDMDAAIKAARAVGADVVVSPFPDPIGVDTVIQWPGGVMMQLYWHTSKPSYAPFVRIPENRIYVSPDRADAFVKSFVAFSNGQITSDDTKAPGVDVGLVTGTIREIQVESAFGKLHVFVTDGHLPYPYGRETTGYEVEDLDATLARASALGVKVLAPPVRLPSRTSAMVLFPGGYIAEIHTSKQEKR